MRGLFTAGVLDFFLDNGLLFEDIYGVSAGACHACSYLSAQRDRARRTIMDYRDNWRYASFRSLLLTGDFFGVSFTYHRIPDKLLPFDYDAFRASPAKFSVVLTNCETGEAEYPLAEDLREDMRLVQAGSSLPLLSRMVRIDGTPYLDGGIADSIPLARSIEDGNRQNIVILTRDREFRKSPASLQALMNIRYRNYPDLLKSIKTRHERYNAALDLISEEEAAGRAFVISPREPVSIGRLERDKDKLQALYDSGYDEAKSSFDSLMNFTQAKEIN